MAELQKKFLSIWYAERPRWILWLPVFLGIGVGIYFGLENEPPLATLCTATIMLAALTWALRQTQRHVAAMLSCVALFVVAGIALATWRTHSLDAPIIKRKLYPQTVTGTVAEITTRPDSTRLTLADAQLEDLTPEQTPTYITVSLRNHADASIALGDRVRLRAGFFPPPKPNIAGGYAFNRHFYFKQIGAMGYGIGSAQPEIITKGETTGAVAQWIARTRHSIAQSLMQRMGSPEGAVAAALMVGESKAIPEDVYESMRQSGLVHVLSISGMHLTLAAGIFFFCARILLAAIPAFSLRHDGKKAAALIALLGTFAYLLLAGMPISAQRSFVMVALVLFAVMLSRNATPMRSLCLAAFLLLCVTPESLLNPGFQLSFAATMAILAYYEHWMEKTGSVPPEEWGWKRKMWRFWGGIIVTSTVATFATMPYILHHFEGLPLYSVLANLVVMPLASFWIMPMVVAALVFMPFGLSGIFLPVLSWGISLMLRMAETVHHMPYAVADVPPLGTHGLVLVTLGGLWLCLWQTKWRFAGIAPIIIGCSTVLFYVPPDIIISADAKKIAIRTAPDEITMLRGQRKGFTQDGWKRFLRMSEYGLRSKAPADALQCDDLGCIYRWNGQEVAFSDHRSTLAEDCRESDMVITVHWGSYYDTREFCSGAQLYDRSWLGKVEGASFWLSPQGIRYRTVLETLGNRPWSGID